MIEQHILALETSGKNDMVDITGRLSGILSQSRAEKGIVLLFVPGSTAALSTIEYEPGLNADFPALMEKVIPEGARYHHDETWHDGNGHSHLRATLLGPSLSIPFKDREMTLGTWQQIVLFEFDNRPRSRQIIMQIMGE